MIGSPILLFATSGCDVGDNALELDRKWRPIHIDGHDPAPAKVKK
jgi:hypothetical protein